MAYPGNTELSPRAQERVMSSFRLVIRNLQDGRKEDALVGLDYVLRLDPAFGPALVLQKQLSTGDGDVSLEDLLAELNAPVTQEINLILVDAIEDFEQHHYLEAKEKVQRVLMELPGHEDARNLFSQIEEALDREAQVGHFLAQAREALEAGDPQEASNFVMMAQALDPHHPGIHPTLEEIRARGPVMMGAEEQALPDVPAGEKEIHEPAMPEHFELEEHPEVLPGPDNSAEDRGAEGDDAFGGDFFEESSGIGDLFEDVVVPEEPKEGSGGVGFGGDNFLSEDLDVEVVEEGKGYEQQANNWKIEVSEVKDEAPAQPVQETEEAEDASWGPEFDSMSGDVSDLFSSDSIDDFGVEDEEDEWKDLSPAGEEPSPEPVKEEAEETESGWSDTSGGEEPVAELPSDVFDEYNGDQNTAEDNEGFFDDDFSVAGEIDAMETRSRERDLQQVSQRGVPLRMVGLGVMALIVVLGGMWFGMHLFSSGNSDEDRAKVVQQLLQDANSLLSEGKPDEALHLLESFQAEGMEKDRIEKHVQKIRLAMAPPTPTPIPEQAILARKALDEGDWFTALIEVQKGLEHHAQDPGLLDLKREIAQVDPQVLRLFRAMERKDDRSIISQGLELEEKFPKQQELHALLDRSLFNGAMKEMRSYNLSGARKLLMKLHERQPNDEEVSRILKFTSAYVRRPVDMQLEIFVRSIKKR